jgi:hypothetical protein
MDKALKEKWVAALRSGNYAQGTDALCTVVGGEARYCCLGVLVEEVYGDDTWKEDSSNGALLRSTGNSCTLGYAERGTLGVTEFVGRLVSMNDTLGKSFEEIADYIEENL